MFAAEIAALPADQRWRILNDALREKDRAEEEAVTLSQSFRKYIPECWKLIEPATPYQSNWSTDAMADHLEACSRREITKLLIMIPPRHMKSSTVAVAWPSWDWTHTPSDRFLFCSYALTLSIRDSTRSRRVMQSSWYRRRWGHMFQMTGDQNAKMRYENDKSGYRIASAVEATATGEGGDYVVIDDPHNIKDIGSDVKRVAVLDWWDQVMPTRVNDAKRGVFIVVMQRCHEADLAGHIMKAGGFEILRLPAEFEMDKRKTSIGWSDPRTKKGELLWPARFGQAEIDHLKRVLGPYGAAGQLQQRPAPAEGGIFKRQWFQLWPHDQKLPAFEFIVQSYDTAFTKDTENDASAGTTWGLFKHPKKGHYCVMLLDAWSEHLEYHALRRKVKEDWESHYGDQKRPKRPDIVLVEEKGSGITLLQDLRLLKVPCYGYNPNKADKLVRAHATVPFAFNGLIYILESTAEPGEPVRWSRDFMHEVLVFDKGTSDNYVDTLTQTILMLRNKGLVIATVGGFEDENDEPMAELHKPKANPYAQ